MSDGTEVVISIVAAVIALGSLVAAIIAIRFARRQSIAAEGQVAAAQDQVAAAREQVLAAREQTELQRQVQREAAQPAVWVDLQPDPQVGGLLLLLLGNSGPTVAVDVKVTFDPPLSIPDTPNVANATTRLAEGISSLTPGRVMQWSLGVVNQQIQKLEENGYRARIEAHGQFGPLPVAEYLINVREIRHNLATPPGTLRGVAVAIEKLTDKLAGS